MPPHGTNICVTLCNVLSSLRHVSERAEGPTTELLHSSSESFPVLIDLAVMRATLGLLFLGLALSATLHRGESWSRRGYPRDSWRLWAAAQYRIRGKELTSGGPRLPPLAHRPPSWTLQSAQLLAAPGPRPLFSASSSTCCRRRCRSRPPPAPVLQQPGPTAEPGAAAVQPGRRSPGCRYGTQRRAVFRILWEQEYRCRRRQCGPGHRGALWRRLCPSPLPGASAR